MSPPSDRYPDLISTPAAVLVPVLAFGLPSACTGLQAAVPSHPATTPSQEVTHPSPEGRRVLQRGPGVQVRVLAFSPDGGLLVANGDGFDLRVWNARTGGFLARLPSRIEHVAAVDFSPDGKILLVRGSGLELWDLSRRERLEAFDPSIDHNRATFSPTGEALLTWGASRPCAALWRLPDGGRLRELGSEDCEAWDAEDVDAAAFSPDGGRIVLARDSALEVWSAGDFELVDRVRHSAGPIWDVSFSDTGARVVAAAGDDAALVWTSSDEAGRTPSDEAGLRRIPFEGMHPRWVEALAGTGIVLIRGTRGSALLEVASGRTTPVPGERDEARVQGPSGTLSIRQGDTVRIADPRSGHMLVAAPVVHPSGPWAVAADGGRVASGWQGVIEIRETGEPSGEPIRLQDRVGAPQRSALSPDGSTVATVGRVVHDSAERSRVDHLHLWDLTTGRPLWTVDGRRYDTNDLEFSPDGRFLATTSFVPGRPALWDVASGERRLQLADTSYSGVRYAPGGARVLLWGTSPTVLVDPVTGRRLRLLGVGAGGPFSPDGRTLAAGGRNVRVWDVQGDSLLREIGPAGDGFRLHGPDIDHAEFHPSGERILAGGYILNPTVYEVGSGDTVATYPVPEPTSSDMVAVFGAYSPHGGRVLTRIETGREAWLWDATDPGRAGDPPMDAPEVVFRSDAVMLDAAFSSDGRLLVTTHADGSTRAWNARTGEELYRRYLVGEEDWVVITPDGRYDGSPDGIREVRRVRGTESVPIDPATDTAWTPGLVERISGEPALTGPESP